MMVHQNASVSSLHVEMDFQLAVLQDACSQADRFWCNELWNRTQPQFGPSAELMKRCTPHDAHWVKTAWESWFSLLTSWDFADTLTGVDLRRLLSADCVSR